jgi:membrane protease YdiL (CAAX protease family)
MLVVVLPIVGQGLLSILLAIQSPESSLTEEATSSPALVAITLVVTAIGEGALVIILLLLLRWVSGLSLRELGYRALRPAEIGIGVLGSIAMALVGDGGESLIETLTKSKHNQLAVEMLKHLHDPRLLWAFGIFAIFIAPFYEETIFRVFVFNAVLRRSGFWFAAIASGILFGLAHGDVYALVPLALGGIVLSYIYYRTGNAFASMISHGLFNAFSVVALVFAPSLSK